MIAPSLLLLKPRLPGVVSEHAFIGRLDLVPFRYVLQQCVVHFWPQKYRDEVKQAIYIYTTSIT